MPEMGADPFGQIAMAATAHHEIFAAYVTAGFTRAEALELVKAIIVTVLQDQPPPLPGAPPQAA